MPFGGHILTSEGPVSAEMDDDADSFEGDIRTHIIGTTIFALAHKFDEVTAVTLFRSFLVPYLFGEKSPLLDVPYGQLLEDMALDRIINEGASRGLNDLFVNIAQEMNLARATRGWRYNRLRPDDDENFLGETKMVAGLPRRITSDENPEYGTRGACVARLVADLKAVEYSLGQYNLGQTQVWYGMRMPPSAIGSKYVPIVVGGSSETDLFMEGNGTEHLNIEPILQYQHSTTGALLWTALRETSTLTPEILMIIIVFRRR